MESGECSQSREARVSSHFESFQAYVSRLRTTEAVLGRSSAANAKGSDLSARRSPTREKISNLYNEPSASSGIKISQMPLAARLRMGFTRPSHELKSPTTLTRRAFGAHTAK